MPVNTGLTDTSDRRNPLSRWRWRLARLHPGCLCRYRMTGLRRFDVSVRMLCECIFSSAAIRLA